MAHHDECRDRIAQALGALGDPRIIWEIESYPPEAAEPGQAPAAGPGPEGEPEQEQMSDEEPMEVEEGNRGFFSSIMELTADPWKAHKLAKWDKAVTRQWQGKRWSDGVQEMISELTDRDIRSHVSEIYSPPRVTGMAPRMGLVPGMALDLTVDDPDDGKPWDFNDPEKRHKALQAIYTNRTLLLIGSPMCAAYRLQNLNWGRMTEEQVSEVKSYGRRHLRFACKLYSLQHEMGAYFLHEHPESATSWGEKPITNLMKLPGVQRVSSDMCVYGMCQEDEEGRALVRKPTVFLTNATGIAQRLKQKCPGGHRHITLIGGRAKRAEIYPDQLCREVLLGLIDQMRMDGRIMGDGCLGSVAQYEEHTTEYKEQMKQYWDELTGKELDPQQVSAARQEEMKEFQKHDVYVKVPLAQCWARTGRKPIGVRWIDINKGDEKKPKYRSRLVAKEIKVDKRDDLFAATPPLEAKKLLLSMAMTEGVGYDRQKRWDAMKLDFIDVRRRRALRCTWNYVPKMGNQACVDYLIKPCTAPGMLPKTGNTSTLIS